jgi:hypothetical protein
MLKTKEKHTSGDFGDETVFQDGFIPANPTIEEIVGNENSDENDKIIVGKSDIVFKEYMYAVQIKSFLYNKTQERQIGSTNFNNFYEVKKGKTFPTTPVDFPLAGVKSFYKQEIYNVVGTLSGIKEDLTFYSTEPIGSGGVSINGDGDSIVRSIYVDNPRSNKGNNPIIVLYNREPISGELCDYYYSDVWTNPDKYETAIYLPVSGTITFLTRYKFLGLDKKGGSFAHFRLSLDYDNEGIVEYNRPIEEIANCFTLHDGHENVVDFNFDKNWDVVLNALKYTGKRENQIEVGFYANFPIILEDKHPLTEEESTIYLTIAMHYDENDPPFYEAVNNTWVNIPPIKIRWGCVAVGSMITMADGTKKAIENVEIGEKVTISDGNALTVRDKTKGTEKELIVVNVKDIMLKLSVNHIVLTEKGPKEAAELKSTDKILCENGEFIEIDVFTVTMEEDVTVYNLALEGAGGYFYAEGLAVIDFTAEDNVTIERPTEKKEISPELKALIEEKIRLDEEFAEKDSF